ncbi:MAG: Crp/Fnr family transcriptional regulator [Spirochaetes bacterium]|nr:Crp/Fnr family transcriptional regulator [Spirochaetota bacterium]
MKEAYGEYRERLAGAFPPEMKPFLDALSFRLVPAGTALLRAGEVATRLYTVVEGCLRFYYIKENGAEITSQFFLEHGMVSSFESARTGLPSDSCIEAIEDSVIAWITMRHLSGIIARSAPVKEYFERLIMTRLIYYMRHHASYIRDNPETRYRNLACEHPEIVARVPQQYIASYLGVTPVSLSRIKNRLKRKN